FLHIHIHDSHPGANPIHIHVASINDVGAELVAGDDDAEIDVDWTVLAKHGLRLLIDLEIAERVLPKTQSVLQADLAPLRLHGPDPPDRIPTHLRGPPA